MNGADSYARCVILKENTTLQNKFQQFILLFKLHYLIYIC